MTTPPRMHADQVEVRVDVVSRLVATQFPQWSNLPVRPVQSDGTVNALFRVGDEVVVRFPLQFGDGPEPLEAELATARLLAGKVSLPVPEPLGLGAPGDGYEGPWTAYRWIPGQVASDTTVVGLGRFAGDLGRFVCSLRAVPTGGRTWPGRGRGGRLADLDKHVGSALAKSGELTDVTAVARAWTRALAAGAHEGPDVWVHTDLMPGNLLVRDGRLAAVIDLGGVNVGDPAVDLMPAWHLMDPRARRIFRDALGADDDAWERGRGWAVVQAIMALPYYVHTNRAMADMARRTLAAVVHPDA